jgi:hypothetical protein
MTSDVAKKPKRNRNDSLPVVHTGEGGRPRYSDAVKRKLLAALRIGMTRYGAAGSAGIHPSTFYEWINKDDDWRAKVEEAEAFGAASYEGDLSSLRRPATPPAVRMRAVEFWLSRRRSKDWKEQTAVELTLPRSVEIARSDLPDDDLAERLAVLGEELVRRGRASRR